MKSKKCELNVVMPCQCFVIIIIIIIVLIKYTVLYRINSCDKVGKCCFQKGPAEGHSTALTTTPNIFLGGIPFTYPALCAKAHRLLFSWNVQQVNVDEG